MKSELRTTTALAVTALLAMLISAPAVSD